MRRHRPWGNVEDHLQVNHGVYLAGDLSMVIRHAVGLVFAVTGVMVIEGRTRVPS